MTPEGKVKAKVVKRLAVFDKKCYRFMPVQMGYGAPGLDFFLCFYGRFVAVETKTKGKKLTARQEATRAVIISAGGLVFVVDGDESLDAMMNYLHVLAVNQCQ